jgi:hypothetical protein
LLVDGLRGGVAIGEDKGLVDDHALVSAGEAEVDTALTDEVQALLEGGAGS